MADRLLDYRDLENEIWHLFYAVAALNDRICDHFGSDRGEQHTILKDAGNVTIWTAGEAVAKANALRDRYNDVHLANGGKA